MPEPTSFSLVIGDPLFRVQRALKLVSDERLNVVKRAVLVAAITWLPMAVWAFVTGGRAAIQGPEAFLNHFDIHVRCLLALPLLIIAEAPAQRIVARMTSELTRAGIIPESGRAQFEAVLRGVERLRDSWLVWGVIFVLALMPAVLGSTRHDLHVLTWANHDGVFGFGGWWYALVTRPINALLMMVWVWRVVVLVILFYRVSKLELRLATAHPDRAAGLGFLGALPSAFSLVTFAFSAVISAHAAHEVISHGVALQSMQVQGVTVLVLMLVIFLSPLFPFSRVLRRQRRRAYFEYGGFIGQAGVAFDERWIQSKNNAPGEVFATSDVSTMCDTGVVYEAATQIRMLPLRKLTLLTIVVPTVIPMLCVVLIRVPLREILQRLAGALV